MRRGSPRLAAVSFLLAVLAGSAGARATPMVFLDIDGQGQTATVAAYSTFSVDVYASGIPVGSDGKGLFGFGFEVRFLPTHASGATATAGALWTGFVSTANSSQKVGLTGNRFGEGAGPSGDDIFLGSFALTSLSASNIALTVEHFTGPGDNVLFNGDFLDYELLSPFFFDGLVLVLPTPHVAALLLPGFAVFGLRRHRIRR